VQEYLAGVLVVLVDDDGREVDAGLGSILRNSISAENVLDKFLILKLVFHPKSTQIYLNVMENNLGSYDILRPYVQLRP
jgi:hypothetical protein